MTDVIQMRGVAKSYQNFQLDHIDLTLPAGEIMGLVGVNGAGKSTTLRILMGLIAPDSGSVNVLGHSLPEQQVEAKRDVGFASEDMRLYKHKNLAWHMNFVQSFFPSWDNRYAQHLAQKFGLPLDQNLKGFSHGQRVKAALLLLLARRPGLLILDEPTTGLDPVARSEVLEELAEVLENENRSVLFSSHNTHDVEQLSDSITFLHDGRVLASEDIESFLEKWRCVRCKGDIDPQALQSSNLAEFRRSGSLINLKLDNYNDSTAAWLQSKGLEVVEVLRMTLEEIFIANVKRGRAQ
ncbi:ABC transporter ATP-binding protein [Gilvimarinus xylanilyticus]|uniref:ABC transporter ATP-binding protein n=1 Tax=Gilvimarinus xylanilyticus TaxID=2944139 RepID=A0A9X2KSQ6_9GAMM|nr:ABC transporter ATP-binding protein [Gilvimarinus xylanilyticus]MCP8899066.1 ABC transporter ATP-binding protein [Gilvimarinus xylanilyticus]